MSLKDASKPIIIAGTAATLAVGLGIYSWKEEHRPPILEIYVFSLKSGRSVFVRTPEDKRILIDGGGNSEVIKHITDILPFYSRRLDTIIATDTDGKDISGLIDVLGRYTVDKIYVPAITAESLGLASSTDRIYSTFIAATRKNHIPVHEVSAGDSIDLDKKVRADILFPVLSEEFSYSKASPPELSMSIVYDANSFVFIGNATKKIQKFIASSTLEGLDADKILKTALYVSQNASPDTLSIELIGALSPESVIYSKNISYIPPKPGKGSDKKKKAPADPLEGVLGDKRFNLKEVGTVKIVSDGTTMSVSAKGK